MVKRILSCLLLFVLYPCVCFAALGDADDGYLVDGEYDYFVEWTSHTPPLIINGGGAEWIEVSGFGRIEVISTSTPLGSDTGIQDIALTDNSQLLFLDGIVEEISIGKDASAVLKDGRIDYIRSQQHVYGSPHITIECQSGWEWQNITGPKTGVTGLWADGTAFDIEFFDDGTGYYNPTWENINIVIVPEPTALALLGLGTLLIRKKK